MSDKKKYTDENPIDPDKVTDNPGLITYAHHVGSAVIRPEDKGKIKGKAMAAMRDQTDRQMHQIIEQMKTLAKQAHDIKRRVEVSEKIYLSRISFEPVIGHTYYLYEDRKKESVLSMIGPGEWGKDMPFNQFLAKVRLLSDHTWEVLEDHL